MVPKTKAISKKTQKGEKKKSKALGKKAKTKKKTR
jgi:hypothetical protein